MEQLSVHSLLGILKIKNWHNIMTNNWRVKSATHLAILSANRGKFDRRDRGKSQSLDRAHLAIFADRRLNRRVCRRLKLDLWIWLLAQVHDETCSSRIGKLIVN